MPQEIKKAAGSAARNKGTNASKTLGYQRHHPLQAISGVVGAVNELPKKRSGPTRSQFDASSPHRREHDQSDGRNPYWSSPLRPNDCRGQQPKKKQRSHALPVFDAFTPYGMMPFNSRAATNPTAIRRSAHLKGGCGTPLKVVKTWFVVLIRSPTTVPYQGCLEDQGMSGTTAQLPPLQNGTSEGFLGSNGNGEGGIPYGSQ